MINPDVERRYADCSELVDAWKNFLDLFNKAVHKTVELNPQIEQAFMDVKARIAMLHDSFMEAVRHDKNVAQNMLTIVNRSITLRHLQRMGQADMKKIEIEWHETYLLLNETVSHLGEERERLANINEFKYKMSKVTERAKLNVKHFVSSIYFKILVVIIALIFIIWGIPAFDIYDYNNLRDMKYVGKPYSALLDLKRDLLHLSGPYSTMQKFEDKYFATPPDGFTIEDGLEASPQVMQLFQTMDVNGQSGMQVLQGASSSAARNITPPSGPPQVQTYAFYWKNAGVPAQFALAYNDNNQPSDVRQYRTQYTMFFDNNVLIILRMGTDSAQNMIRQQVFKK
ncbi:hypothetical protein KQI84_09810 [bacterium]|nr:hypothetical protein [bacterium]